MNRKYHILALSTVSIVTLDQASKFYVDKYVALNESIEVVKGMLNITHIRNTGAAFGLLSDISPPLGGYFFISISIFALIGILYFLKKIDEDELIALSLSLIFGGALGNLIDRVRMGVVIDFIDLYIKSYHWPAFNVADTCITLGAVLLMLKFTKRAKRCASHIDHNR